MGFKSWPCRISLLAAIIVTMTVCLCALPLAEAGESPSSGSPINGTDRTLPVSEGRTIDQFERDYTKLEDMFKRNEWEDAVAGQWSPGNGNGHDKPDDGNEDKEQWTPIDLEGAEEAGMSDELIFNLGAIEISAGEDGAPRDIRHNGGKAIKYVYEYDPEGNIVSATLIMGDIEITFTSKTITIKLPDATWYYDGGSDREGGMGGEGSKWSVDYNSESSPQYPSPDIKPPLTPPIVIINPVQPIQLDPQSLAQYGINLIAMRRDFEELEDEQKEIKSAYQQLIEDHSRGDDAGNEEFLESVRASYEEAARRNINKHYRSIVSSLLKGGKLSSVRVRGSDIDMVIVLPQKGRR